MKSNTTEGGT